jgi:D-alanine-D-alanine ligase
MKNVAILFGGRSVEHEISVLTALEALQALDTSRFKPTLVYIDLHGRWWTGDKLKDKSFYQAFASRSEGAKVEVEEVILLPVPGMNGLVRGQKDSVMSSVARLFGGGGAKKDTVLPIDVFMPLLHGTFGEDGCIQGLFEMAEVAYTGSAVLAAATGMSKPTTKALAKARGVPVLPWEVVEARDWNPRDPGATVERLSAALGPWPLFVKPANLGSSVGVAKAEDGPALIAALVKVFRHDSQAIVEPCVQDLSEINVSVRDVGSALASVVEMPVTRSKSGVLTYEDKYVSPGGKAKMSGGAGMANMARVIDPKDLPPEYRDAAREHAATVYAALGCKGVARIDFILDGARGALYFNEINTLPGSLAHYLWSASAPSLTYTELLTHLLDEGIARHAAERQLSREFGFKALK